MDSQLSQTASYNLILLPPPTPAHQASDDIIVPPFSRVNSPYSSSASPFSWSDDTIGSPSGSSYSFDQSQLDCTPDGRAGKFGIGVNDEEGDKSVGGEGGGYGLEHEQERSLPDGKSRKRRRKKTETPRDMEKRKHACPDCGKVFVRCVSRSSQSCSPAC